MKFLIACLGNIGDEYANTRHNVGFLAADSLVKKLSEGKEKPFVFTTSRYASMTELKFKGRTLIVIKPSTFMNLSGNAVSYWMKEEKISILNLLVITDDLALPFGTLRIRSKGGAGGHNGLTHIIEVLGSQDFCRLRFGIGNEFRKGNQVNYVLGEWTKEEQSALGKPLDKVAEIVTSFVTAGIDRTMSKFNRETPGEITT